MPPFIKSRYQQYKEDNRDLATWLGRTAIHYGYPVDSFTVSDPLIDVDVTKTPQQTKNAKKKKSKAKAKVKEGEGDPGSEEPALKGSFFFKTRQYLEVVRFLIGKDVSFPVEVARLLRRCILNRERCAQRFVRETSATDGHLHFLSQLKEVETLINAHRGKSMPLGDRLENVSLSSENRFASLPSENIEDVPDISLPEPPRPAVARPTTGTRFTPEPTTMEIIVDILTFFEDIHATRDYVKVLWRDYKAGVLDLMSASVTTNTALELLRQSSDSVKFQVDAVFGGDLGLAILSMKLLLVGGDMERMLATERLFSDIPMEDQTLSAVFDYLLVPNFQILVGLGQVLAQGDIPVYKPGYYGDYNANLKFDKIRLQDRWKQAQILICETLMDYPMLLMSGDEKQLRGEKPSLPLLSSNNYFAFDETAAEMERFVATSKCSLFLMIVSQVFVDINFILGRDAERGMKDLRAGAKQMLQSIKKWEAASPPAPLIELGHERNLATFKDEAAFGESEDPVDIWRTHGIDGRVPAHKSNFMQRTPLLCGVLLFRLQLAYQRIGFFVANSTALIQSTAHLYIACRQFGTPLAPSMPDWPDMDMVVDIHGTELFGGSIPKTIDDSYLAFLEMTSSPIDMMRTVRHIGTDSDVPAHLLGRQSGGEYRTPKLLNDHTQIQPIFVDEYVLNPRARTTVDQKQIASLLSDLVRGGGTLRRQRSHKAPKFSIPQLLAVLEAGLERETGSLRFDYFSMHLRCSNILATVKRQSRDYLENKGHRMPEDHELSMIVALILHVATMSSRAAAQFGLKPGRGLVMGSRLLTGAADAMKDALKDPKERNVEKRKVESSKRSAV